jgi:hypothetical protein
MSYRISVVHFEKSIEEKIENRDKEMYKSKTSYILEALKNFEEKEKKRNENFLDFEKRMEEKMETLFEEIKKIISENQNKKSEEMQINIPSTETFYEPL